MVGRFEKQFAVLYRNGMVILFVIVMALFLWAVDGLLFWLVKPVMGRGD